MKAIKIAPIRIREGYSREALIELNYDEACGFLELLTEVLKDSMQNKKMWLDFQSSVATHNSIISFVYEEVDSNNAVEKWAEFEEIK